MQNTNWMRRAAGALPIVSGVVFAILAFTEAVRQDTSVDVVIMASVASVVLLLVGVVPERLATRATLAGTAVIATVNIGMQVVDRCVHGEVGLWLWLYLFLAAPILVTSLAARIAVVPLSGWKRLALCVLLLALMGGAPWLAWKGLRGSAIGQLCVAGGPTDHEVAWAPAPRLTKKAAT